MKSTGRWYRRYLKKVSSFRQFPTPEVYLGLNILTSGVGNCRAALSIRRASCVMRRAKRNTHDAIRNTKMRDKKILIIDDNEDDRLIIKKILNRAGWNNLVFANNGEEGVEKAKKELPDLAITDTMLPGINGFQVCEQIKKKEALNVKVIVMTGVIDAVDAVKAREMGADDWCVKTASGAPLIEVVKNLIGA